MCTCATILKVGASDHAESLDLFEWALGRQQPLGASHCAQAGLETSVVRFDPIVLVLPGYVANQVFGPEPCVPFADDLGVAGRFVRHDCPALIGSQCISGVAYKAHCCAAHLAWSSP